MIPDFSFRFFAVLVSLFIHAALLGLFMFVLPPAGDGGRAQTRSNRQGALVFQLIAVDQDRTAAADDRPVPAAPARTSVDAPARSRPSPSADASRPSPPAPAEGAVTRKAAAAGDTVGDAAPAELSGAITLRYRDQLLAHIGRYRQYPEEARREHRQGTSWVRFLLDREGRVLRLTVERGSGHDMLDREAAAAVRRAEPLPRIPAGLPGQIDITVPIDFRIG